MFKILVVDDEVDIVDMLKDYFKINDYQVLTAYDGEEAIEKLKFNPDLIILDINMPKINGLDLCKKIRDKLKKQTDYEYISTVWGVGYKWNG